MSDEVPTLVSKDCGPDRSAYFKKYRQEHKAEAHAYYLSIKPKKLFRDRGWRANNRHKYNLQQSEYRQKNREKLRAYHRIWRQLRKDHLLQRSREYRLKNIDKIRQSGRNYMRRHPAEVRARLRKRRQLRTQAAGNLKLMSEWMVQMRAKRKVKCYYCNHLISGKQIHFDHVIPLSRGGAHSVENLACSCPSCNMSKHSRLPSEWKKIDQITMDF